VKSAVGVGGGVEDGRAAVGGRVGGSMGGGFTAAGASHAVGVGVAVAALEAIRAHAEAAYPEECCGALVGWSGGVGGRGRGRVVVRAIPTGNGAVRGRGRRYLIPGEVVRAVEAEARAGGLAVVGFYHSHPDGGAEPSRSDLELAWPWYSYLIAGVSGGRAGAIRGWRLRDDRATFEPETLWLAGEEA